MNVKDGIETYGYVGVLIGTLLEGDIALVLGGLCARCTDLRLYGVILAAFMGAIIGDQACYNLGRHKGLQLLNRFPRLKLRTERVFHHLRRHGSVIAFAFRFVYGFRILTPLLIGASGVGRGRFTLLNCLGALSWATVLGCLGYAVGEALAIILQNLKEDLRHVLPMILLGLLVLVGLLRLGLWLFRRRRDRLALQAKTCAGAAADAAETISRD
jgi:membrane protein DedA with SNARE-associated domain